MKATKRKFIAIPRKARIKLCGELNITQPTLSLALHFKCNSQKSIRARELAVSKYGGVESFKVIFE